VSRTLKIVAIVVGVLILIALIVPFLIPVNQFRPTIEEKASAALGRKVEVGNLSLSLLSGGLGVDNLSIADDPQYGKSPFLMAKSVKVGVEMMPLIFSKTLNVTEIVIDSPQVNLIRDAQGKWNMSTLGSSTAKPQSAAPAPTTPATAPASESASKSSEFSIQKLELKNGKISVGSTGSSKVSTYDNVSVVASNVSMTSQFPIAVKADLPGGGDFKADGTAGPVNQANSQLTPINAKLTVENLNIAKTGLVDSSAGLGGNLDLNATFQSQSGVAATKGSAKLSKALLVAGGSPSGVPVIVDFGTKYNLAKNSGVLDPSTLKIGGATAHLSGTYDIPADGAVVKLKVQSQNMPAKDLETFLPALGINLPKGAALEAGTLNTDLDLNGPVNKMVTTGSVGLFGGKIAGFDLGSKMSSISSLAGIKTGGDLVIEKLTSNVRVAPDGIKADNFNAVVPSMGSMVGGGTVDSKNALDFKMVATLASSVVANVASPVSSVTGMLGKATGGGSGGGCKQGATVPFQIKGTTSDPKFIPDVGGLAAGMLKSQLGCAGGVAGAAGQAAPQGVEGAVGQLGGLLKKKKP
jgi:AsmA protein